MCKTMVKEVNENRKDIIEIKGHLGLPCDIYHELPKIDDPFAEWDAHDSQAHVDPTPSTPAPVIRAASRRSRRACGDNEDTEEDIPSNYHEHDDEEEDDDTEDDDDE